MNSFALDVKGCCLICSSSWLSRRARCNHCPSCENSRIVMAIVPASTVHTRCLRSHHLLLLVLLVELGWCLWYFPLILASRSRVYFSSSRSLKAFSRSWILASCSRANESSRHSTFCCSSVHSSLYSCSFAAISS